MVVRLLHFEGKAKNLEGKSFVHLLGGLEGKEWCYI